MKKALIYFLFPVLVVLSYIPTNVVNAQPGPLILSTPGGIYSPNLIYIGGVLRMYAGGWLTPTQYTDTIYRANCPEPQPQTCTNLITVVQPLPCNPPDEISSQVRSARGKPILPPA